VNTTNRYNLSSPLTKKWKSTERRVEWKQSSIEEREVHNGEIHKNHETRYETVTVKDRSGRDDRTRACGRRRTADAKYNEIQRDVIVRVAATKLRREDKIILYGTRLLSV